MLHRLIYHSYATTDITSPYIQNILDDCRKYNSEHHVTGCLLVNKHQFLQMLEGEQNDLEKIYESIKADQRNTDVVLIENKIAERRLFPMSAMVYEVVGKDDFEKIGASEKEDLSFLIKSPEMAIMLFEHVKKLMELEPMKQGLWHSATLGPLSK